MPNEAKWAIALAVGAALVWSGWKVTWILVTMHVLVCLLLVVVIMLQSGNAADLAGAFGGAGSQTAFGPRGPASFLSKATTWCAVMFMLTSLTLWLKRGPGQGEAGAISSILEQTQKSAPPPVKSKPAPPVQTPPKQSPAMPPPVNSAPAMPAPASPKP
jgi:preprotein translocase subunit SecG